MMVVVVVVAVAERRGNGEGEREGGREKGKKVSSTEKNWRRVSVCRLKY